MVKAEKYAVYKSTVIGASHLNQNKICQDFSLAGEGREYRFGALADGHGGEDHFRSDRGSRFACEVFASGLGDGNFRKRLAAAESERERAALIAQFTKSFISRWNTAVEADLAAEPISEEELSGASDRAREKYAAGESLSSIYGTTFLGFAFVGDTCFGIQIGDGRCVIKDKIDALSEPILPDPDCFLNVTTSLCAENAYEKSRSFSAREGDGAFPEAVFLCTDGVCNSFTDENFLEFCALTLENLKQGEDAAAELFEYLPTLSQKGSGDDMSVCIIINTEI